MKPFHEDCTIEEYHARPELSRSQHTDLLESPELFHDKYLTPFYPRVKKKAWDTGNVGHCLFLEPGTVDSVVAVIPVDDFRTAKGGKSNGR